MPDFPNAASESLDNARIVCVFFLAFEKSFCVKCSVNSATVPKFFRGNIPEGNTRSRIEELRFLEEYLDTDNIIKIFSKLRF